MGIETVHVVGLTEDVFEIFGVHLLNIIWKEGLHHTAIFFAVELAEEVVSDATNLLHFILHSLVAILTMGTVDVEKFLEFACEGQNGGATADHLAEDFFGMVVASQLLVVFVHIFDEGSAIFLLALGRSVDPSLKGIVVLFAQLNNVAFTCAVDFTACTGVGVVDATDAHTISRTFFSRRFCLTSFQVVHLGLCDVHAETGVVVDNLVDGKPWDVLACL